MSRKEAGPDGQKMKVWTCQPREVLDALIGKGTYRTDPRKAGLERQFVRAYDWMVEEMEKRIGERPDGVTYPIWAFAVCEGKRRPPDLDGFAAPGTRMVLMELEIPEKDLVLSDFDTWHYVLNDWYYIRCQNKEEWDRQDKEFDALPPQVQRQKKTASWQAVFDTELRDNGEYDINGFQVQATFWELKREYLVAAVPFTAP